MAIITGPGSHSSASNVYLSLGRVSLSRRAQEHVWLGRHYIRRTCRYVHKYCVRGGDTKVLIACLSLWGHCGPALEYHEYGWLLQDRSTSAMMYASLILSSSPRQMCTPPGYLPATLTGVKPTQPSRQPDTSSATPHLLIPASSLLPVCPHHNGRAGGA
jgi:hypothetical protein